MEQQLYWPPVPPVWMGTTLIVVGIISSCLIFPLALIPIGFMIHKRESRNKKEALQRRQRAIEATNSVLMSKVEYVGGHPLIPNAGEVVIGLSPTQFTIYSLGNNYSIRPLTSIPLEDIVRAGMGRPKSAREVYNEDYGYTIDVYEHSPFLSIIFELEGETYRMSFQYFESQTPREWYNQIVAFQYQLRLTKER